MVTTTFAASPRMSSYLVAFVVSKFTCSEGVPIADKVAHYVCSTPDTQNDRFLANSYSAVIMQTLENFTGIPYNQSGLNKMHQVAVPDFSAGAMENWGLVTYRYDKCFLNSKEFFEYSLGFCLQCLLLTSLRYLIYMIYLALF